MYYGTRFTNDYGINSYIKDVNDYMKKQPFFRISEIDLVQNILTNTYQKENSLHILQTSN